MSDAEHQKQILHAHKSAGKHAHASGEAAIGEASHPIVVFMAWMVVGIPLLYGFWNTVQKAVLLFK
jgi:hypothetical protein